MPREQDPKSEISPEFMEIADELAIWKFMPSGKDRGAFAAKLSEWCDKDATRGWWLLSRVDEFDEYPGPRTIRAMIKDKFQPAGALTPYSIPPQFKRASEEIGPIRCSRCGDLGTVEANGSQEWCTCDYAKRLAAEMPDWLAFVNRHQSTRGGRLTKEHKAIEARRALQGIERGYAAGGDA